MNTKMNFKKFTSDLSFSAMSAGFIAVLVGYASAWVIVYQAAIAAGASQAMIDSWIWALGMSMGLGCLGLSLYYKRPIIIAWSTPGAALLATTLGGNSIGEAIGIFVFVGVLTSANRFVWLVRCFNQTYPFAISFSHVGWHIGPVWLEHFYLTTKRPTNGGDHASDFSIRQKMVTTLCNSCGANSRVYLCLQL